MNDANIDNAEPEIGGAAEGDDNGDEGSWPVLSDLDLAVCITDSTLPQGEGRGTIDEPTDTQPTTDMT